MGIVKSIVKFVFPDFVYVLNVKDRSIKSVVMNRRGNVYDTKYGAFLTGSDVWRKEYLGGAITSKAVFVAEGESMPVIFDLKGKTKARVMENDPKILRAIIKSRIAIDYLRSGGSMDWKMIVIFILGAIAFIGVIT